MGTRAGSDCNHPPPSNTELIMFVAMLPRLPYAFVVKMIGNTLFILHFISCVLFCRGVNFFANPKQSILRIFENKVLSRLFESKRGKRQSEGEKNA